MDTFNQMAWLEIVAKKVAIDSNVLNTPTFTFYLALIFYSVLSYHVCQVYLLVYLLNSIELRVVSMVDDFVLTMQSRV